VERGFIDLIGPGAPFEGDSQQHRALMGRGGYVDDVDLPGQLWLAVVRSPVAHGTLRGVDRSAAAALPGVRAVLTAEDLDRVPHIPIRVLPQPEMASRLQPVLAFERVRYVGEPIAVVVADDPYLAEDAADLVELDIEALPVTLDATDPSPAGMWSDGDGNALASFHALWGPDADSVIDGAHRVVRGTFTTQRHTAVPIETRGLVAQWRGDELHLWGVTKFVTFTRKTLAGFFGIDPERVVCHRVDVGGMFGVRGEVYPEDFLVPWAASVVGRPVKWVEDRREHFLSINHSRQQAHQLELAVDENGRFLALRVDGVLDVGAYPRPIGGRITQIAAESLSGPYHWDSLDIRCRAVATNKTPSGTIRGPSSYEVTFVRERAIDIAAQLLGMDGLELRRRNLIRGAEMPFVQDLGEGMHPLQFDTGDYPAILDVALERAGYQRLVEEVSSRRAAGETVGLGMALFLDHSGLGSTESVSLSLEHDGSFLLGTSAAEVGQGLDRTAALVLSRELGVPPGAVRVWSGDSRAHGVGNGTFASRSAIFVGSAATDASVQLGDEGRRRAADLLGVAIDELERTPEGFTTAEGVTAQWKELAPIDVVGSHQQEHATYGFTVQLAVVVVDPGTGGVEVERVVIGYDCGRMLDPVSVRGQLVGAAVMGVGGALLEEITYDGSGQPLSTTFIDYLMPSSAQAPAVDTHVIEDELTKSNPLGIKGAGEAGIIGVGAAVANAVADAVGPLGTQITSLPLRPETVRQLMAEAHGADRR
jgi:CO/xanthine dehydrogenase Mo-binding subunit